MTPAQAIGWSLNQASAITAIVGNKIYHGLKPTEAVVPCINYFEMGGGQKKYGMITQIYSINCRAATAGAARTLAKAVVDLFDGADSNGTFGTQNSFDIARISLRYDQGLIPEIDSEAGVFNAPLDFALVYSSSTVS
jgi:hypothetical protein